MAAMTQRTFVTAAWLMCWTPALAGGLERTWIDPLGGTFSTAASWTPAGVPGLLDTAIFDLNLTYGIGFAAPSANELMNMSEGVVTFDLALGSYTLNGAIVGDKLLDVGTLTLLNGTLTIVPLVLPPTLKFRIGKDPGAIGTLVVSAGASLMSNDVLIVGDAGTGTLVISGGGTATTAGVLLIGDDIGSSGTVTIDGLASTLTHTSGVCVGNEGAGTLSIGNGGFMNSMAPVRIGDNDTAVGAATLQGPTSVWTATAAITVGNSGTGTLAVTDGATLNSSRLKIGNDLTADGTMTVDGPTTSWTDSQTISVGNGGAGTLQITGGATVTGVIGRVGDDFFSLGTALVDGAGSSWSSSVELSVGLSGSGTLTASNGGALTAPEIIVGKGATGELNVLSGSSVIATLLPVRIGDLFASNGTINVDGTGSVFTSVGTLFVGNVGTGTLTITDGGSVFTTDLFVADDLGSSGTVVVRGVGASWNVSQTVSLGNGGTGTLSVLDGATATFNSFTRLGDNLGSDGSVFVSGPGATWNVQAELLVGNSSSGSVTVTNGGAVNTARVKLGDDVGTIGTAAISGAASTWTDTVEIFVGNFGTGVLTVSDGGSVSGVGGTLGDDPGSNGSATISGAGSIWANSLHLFVGDLGQGTLTLVDGGEASAPIVTVNALGVIEGDGTVTGAVSNSGIVRPGLSKGELVVDGSYVQTALGTLDIELACPTGDTLTVSGAVTLAGTLNLSLVFGSEPIAGQQFQIVTGSPVIGAFTTINAPPGVTVSVEPGAVVVTVTLGGPPAVGDIDGDGTIGITDFLALLAAWGPNPGHPADLDGDGMVGITDFLLLLANWGPACP